MAQCAMETGPMMNDKGSPDMVVIGGLIFGDRAAFKAKYAP